MHITKTTLLTAALLLASTGAWAQMQTRPVTTPGDINSPGSYTLIRDIRGGISINADDVTLDMNGYSISGSGGLTGIGIDINGEGVEVFGGSIRNFGMGVRVSGSANVRLHGLRIRATDLAVSAPPPEIGIMIVQSQNVVVEDNAIYNVGLGIFVRGGMSRGNRIAGNTITAGNNGLLGICYNPAPNDPNGPRGDLITGNVINNFNGGISLSDLSLANVVQGNTIAYKSSDIAFTDESNLAMDNVSVELP